MFCSGFDSELRISQRRRPCMTNKTNSAVLQDACYLCYLSITCLLSTSKRTSAFQMCKMEGEGTSLIFQTEPRASVRCMLCIWISKCKITGGFLVEVFSNSYYILETHRVFKRKHEECNAIKVLHWKCEGFSWISVILILCNFGEVSMLSHFLRGKVTPFWLSFS